MSDNHRINLTNSQFSIGEVNHLELLSDSISSLLFNEEYSDVKFVVEGNKFYAHKIILASRSDYFRALLYGGMKESLPECTEIELKDAPAQAFKILLKYIYSGKMNLSSQKEETLLETLGLANQYGFVHLEAAISDYLKAILTVRNVCMIFDMANLYRLTSLRETCFQYMDRHSAEIIEHRIYLSLSSSAMHDMIRRDSFCAKEIDIFKAVHEWSQANPNSDPTEILSAVRYPLMTLQEIMDTVRPTTLIPPDHLLDAIREKIEKRNCELNYRGYLAPEENVATFRHGAHVILGEKRAALLDGDTQNYDLDRGFTRHPIDDPAVNSGSTSTVNNNDATTSTSTTTMGHTNANGAASTGIVIKLGTQCIINHIRILLWDKDLRSYSYYIETSVDQTDWVRVIDHSKYLCRSWQNLFFQPRVVRYIKIVGTHNTVNRVFHLIHCEAMYTCKPYKIIDGLLCPNENIASLTASACVIEGVSRCRNALINGDYKSYDWDSGYTCHQIGSGCIVIQLAQPYVISSIRLLLWDCDDRSYKYLIKTSVDQIVWELAVDKTGGETCRSWQNLTFRPRPVIFIKIEGTHNTANEVFHCVHVECPNTLMLEPSTTLRNNSLSISPTPSNLASRSDQLNHSRHFNSSTVNELQRAINESPNNTCHFNANNNNPPRIDNECIQVSTTLDAIEPTQNQMPQRSDQVINDAFAMYMSAFAPDNTNDIETNRLIEMETVSQDFGPSTSHPFSSTPEFMDALNERNDQSGPTCPCLCAETESSLFSPAEIPNSFALAAPFVSNYPTLSNMTKEEINDLVRRNREAAINRNLRHQLENRATSETKSTSHSNSSIKFEGEKTNTLFQNRDFDCQILENGNADLDCEIIENGSAKNDMVGPQTRWLLPQIYGNNDDIRESKHLVTNPCLDALAVNGSDSCNLNNKNQSNSVERSISPSTSFNIGDVRQISGINISRDYNCEQTTPLSEPTKNAIKHAPQLYRSPEISRSFESAITIHSPARSVFDLPSTGTSSVGNVLPHAILTTPTNETVFGNSIFDDLALNYGKSKATAKVSNNYQPQFLISNSLYNAVTNDSPALGCSHLRRNIPYRGIVDRGSRSCNPTACTIFNSFSLSTPVTASLTTTSLRSSTACDHLTSLATRIDDDIRSPFLSSSYTSLTPTTSNATTRRNNHGTIHGLRGYSMTKSFTHYNDDTTI